MQLQDKLEKKGRNNVFIGKQRTKKVPRNIFTGLEVNERLMLYIAKDSMKGKYYGLYGYKERNTVWLLYSECKLQQERYC